MLAALGAAMHQQGGGTIGGWEWSWQSGPLQAGGPTVGAARRARYAAVTLASLARLFHLAAIRPDKSRGPRRIGRARRTLGAARIAPSTAGLPIMRWAARRRGCSSMVERQLPKLHTRVRFPSPAPAAAPGPFRFTVARPGLPLCGVEHRIQALTGRPDLHDLRLEMHCRRPPARPAATHWRTRPPSLPSARRAPPLPPRPRSRARAPSAGAASRLSAVAGRAVIGWQAGEWQAPDATGPAAVRAAAASPSIYARSARSAAVAVRGRAGRRGRRRPLRRTGRPVASDSLLRSPGYWDRPSRLQPLVATPSGAGLPARGDSVAEQHHGATGSCGP